MIKHCICLKGVFIHLYMGLFCDNLLLVLPHLPFSFDIQSYSPDARSLCLINPLPTKYAIMRHFKCARGRPKTHICVIETHLRAPEANTAWGRCKTVKELFRYRSWRVRGYRKLCYLGGAETQRETRMRTYRIIAKQLREQPLEVVVILSTQVAHLSVNNIPRALLISVGGAGMAAFTASQVR